LRRRSRLKRLWSRERALSINVGDRLRLLHFLERGLSSSDRIELVIDPGPSFGAGDHPTTVMALELLEITVKRASQRVAFPSVLDVGTGTGVLAVAGKALGTGFTVGLDIDPAAIFTARRNASLNGRFVSDSGSKSGAHFLVGGPEAVKGLFDIVVANLVAPVLLRVCEELTAKTRRFLILSGIIDPMVSTVIDRFECGALKLVAGLQKDGWNACMFQRKNG
jgi:ribosomal protein L11 methyltransferase